MVSDTKFCVQMEADKAATKTVQKEVANDPDFDDLLSSAGEFGRYQILLFLSTAPFYAFGVFIYFSQLFITEVSPNHWCWIPELENLTDIERRSLAIPKDEYSRFGYSRCTSYVANWTHVILTGEKPSESWDKTICQHGWEFNKTEIPYPTISSEMGWVCDKDSYQATAQAIFFLGSILGGLLIGWFADRFGRLPAAVISNLIACVGGIMSIFVRNFTEFAACRFLMGISYDNCLVMVYLLILEYIAPRYRTLIANLSFAIFYGTVVTLLPWIVLACGDWKIISLVTSLPLLITILAPFFIPESSRWLLSKGRIDDAVKKILTIGRINKKEISPKTIEQFKISIANKKEEDVGSSIDIIKRPLLRRAFILICVLYMCCNIVFDGLVRNIGQLDFDFFLSFSVISFTEFPSVILVAFIMDWLGKRWLTAIMMSISCIFSILTVFIGGGILSVSSAVVARFSVNMAYSACMQWAAELLPTPVRGSGVAFVHICSFIATFLSPYIVYLEVYIFWLPSVIIGATAGLGAILAIFLPETARKDMPQTFEEAEDLMRNHKIWDIPFREQNKKVEGHVNDSFEI